jgi:hypothetical protein
VADVIWAIIALVSSVGSIALLIYLQARGRYDRDEEDAARDFFDRHGHWPDERPPG